MPRIEPNVLPFATRSPRGFLRPRPDGTPQERAERCSLLDGERLEEEPGRVVGVYEGLVRRAAAGSSSSPPRTGDSFATRGGDGIEYETFDYFAERPFDRRTALDDLGLERAPSLIVDLDAHRLSASTRMRLTTLSIPLASARVAIS